MNLLPKSKEEFSEEQYWNAFFKKRGNKAFEWYGEYPELSKYLHKYLKPQDDILIVGCGNSTLGRDLYDIGCLNITNIDISKVVIRQMLSQKDKDRPGLKYIQMDALSTSFKNDEFNVIIDKGTLDALMPDDSEETRKKIDQYFLELNRLLRNNGRYICISLLQAHILQKLLDFFPSNNWMFRAVRCFEAEQKSVENGENALPVFIVICTKFKALPRKILEINLSIQDSMQKCQTIEEVASHISSAQKAAFICSSLKKSNIGSDDEIALEIFEPGDQTQPRYSVYVVEVGPKKCSYAAFIVPEGREAEWLFSTKAGRKNLATMTDHTRLAIVTMHRGRKYESLDAVQKELNDIVRNLAPSDLNMQKIPFLTLGTDLGRRTIIFTGTSHFSGDYVIEDVEHEDGQKFRRLFYINSQLVIQSEAKIKTIKTRGGKKKDIVDLSTLTCQHHVYMSIAAHLSVRNKTRGSVVVLGLGGGGLCSFLRKFLSNADITGVDIDVEMLKIATQWFGFNPDEKLEAKIQDGLEFIRDLNKEGISVDAVLCDVDNKSADIGMSCPPKEFLSNEILKVVSKVIGPKGVFVANVVLRDQTLRPEILATIRESFQKVISYKLAEDLNEIFICTNMEMKNKQLKEHLTEASEAVNLFFKKNSVKDEVEISEYINALKINS